MLSNEVNVNMTNGENSSIIDKSDKELILTANEVANVLGESYKTVAKVLMSLATESKIAVTEKLVNNRPLKGYILNVSDLQVIKERFSKGKHSENKGNAPKLQMVANALNTDNRGIIENSAAEVPNVKFYEVMKENAELTKELDKLKTDMQTKINENVRLDADLTVAKSELKYITDKSSSMEAAYSEQKLEVERLNKVIRNRNFALICLGAVLLIILTVASTIALMK